MAKIPGGLRELLADAPSNWGRWGPADQVGSLNYLTPAEVLRGIQAVTFGKVFTLMLQLGILQASHYGQAACRPVTS